jgi:hypothetical protein
VVVVGGVDGEVDGAEVVVARGTVVVEVLTCGKVVEVGES